MQMTRRRTEDLQCVNKRVKPMERERRWKDDAEDQKEDRGPSVCKK